MRKEAIFNSFEIIKLLGLKWAIWRLFYALKLRLGVLRRKTPIQRWEDLPAPEITGKFFSPLIGSKGAIHSADEIRKGRFTFFSHHQFNTGFPPNWFANPFEEEARETGGLSNRHWSKISDFGHGDIKCIWELSRFAWVYPMVQAYGATGDGSYSEAFWQLVTDWAVNNPPNQGVHWKCGQEIAIRMLAMMTGYFNFQETDTITHEQKKMPAKIVFESAKRIEANIGYALSQQNNHGISEAVGLFTAGILFNKSNWIEKGSKHLENQIRTLVYEDGSFSQHSANYHRIMLQACLWAIQLGRVNGADFSEGFIERIRKAGQWLLTLYDPQTGHMPNMGANDGAFIFPYSTCDYRDYRPTIQAVGAVVDGKRWLPAGKWDDLSLWLVADLSNDYHAKAKIQVKAKNSDVKSSTLKSNKVHLNILGYGGYAVFKHGNAKLVFRCPVQFKHRPAQCDLLHVDLWDDGINILRDAGTYSYNCEQPWQDYFKSVSAHNTVQFDEHDQIPQISRFLYGKWPRINIHNAFKTSQPYIEAGFADWKGCFHQRKVEVDDKSIRVRDRISGFKNKAVLRWRLAPEMEWRLDKNVCRSKKASLTIATNNGLKSIRLIQGWESFYYMDRTPLLVLEVDVDKQCRSIASYINLKT